MPTHFLAVGVLDRGATADRLRNHLRRRAIVRPGLIEGDRYLLPFRRAVGRGPEGETGFHLLAAELGDARLLRVDLPDADLKPFEPADIAGGSTVVEATLGDEELRARAAAVGWEVLALEDLIHYPFWLMRVEDSGRREGAWMDGVEGKIILHSLKVPPPLPSARATALALALPAAVMAAAAWLASWPVALGVGVLASLGVAGAVPVWLAGRRRREREG